jgi:flagellar hook-associated protein FlgK
VSTFSGLNAATTALWAQRRALDVTGQNIANATTEGYSRQRVELQAMGGSTVPAFYSTSPGIGEGVNADTVTRIRDAFLEGRGHLERASTAQLTEETAAYTHIERAFREPGETGIQSLLSDVWSGWEDVANNNDPKDVAARGQVLQRLESLVGGIHASHANLGSQWQQNREALQVLVDDVNASAQAVGELNGAILLARRSGLPANDLTDQRDLLVMQLAGQIGATVRAKDDGVVDVLVGGMSLVSGDTATLFALAGTTDPDLTGANPVMIVTAAGGYTVRPGGTAAGTMSTLNAILPAYRAQLDSFAADLATSLNTVHTAGYDLAGAAGTNLLGSSGGPITAASIVVAITDPAKLAASAVAPTAGVPALDNGNADAIAQLRQLPTGSDASYRRMIVELGVQSAVAQRNLVIQTVIATQVDAARESVAGVNIDEEMTNMLQFQHAYAAAGRLVTAIDETLDVLINRTGLVGR